MENIRNERSLYDPYTADSKVLSGMFIDRASTERTYNKLLAKGYSLDEIILLMSENTRQIHYNYMKNESDFGAKIAEVVSERYASGGTFSLLESLGLPESRIKLYYSGIMVGNVVIILRPKDEADAIYFLNNWKTNKGEEVHY